MTSAWTLKKEKYERIGVKRLWQHSLTPSRWAVSLDNRTYHEFYEVPPEKVETWRKKFGT